MADTELQNAKQILMHNRTDISCLKCRLILEVTIDQQLGDLYRNQFNSSCDSSIEKLSDPPSKKKKEKLSDAEKLYKSALEKLNQNEWKNSISDSKEASETDQSDTNLSRRERQEAKMEVKNVRKSKRATKKLPQEPSVPEHNSRMTRSRSHSTQNKSESLSGEGQIGLDKNSKSNPVSACVGTLSQKMSLLEVKSPALDSGCEVKCVCNKMKCWQCLPVEVMASGLLNDFIHLKWEFVRRRLLLKLLTGIGKCLGVRGEIHDTHEVFLQCIANLVGRHPFCQMHSSVLITSYLDLIGKEIPGDFFAIERAAALYNICWFALKIYNVKETRIDCCDLSKLQIPKIMSWLLLAFVLCREVPILFQKVSRLLTAVCMLSASSGSFSFPLSSCKALSQSHWASFFHQASIGTHLNHQLLSSIAGKHNAQNLKDVEDSSATSSTCSPTETYNIFRLAPKSLHDLEKFVTNFFGGLPQTTVICLSLLGSDFASILNDLHPSSIGSWMLLSRFNSNSQPLVVLLPLNSILEDEYSTNSGSGILFEENDSSKHWGCPWGSTVIDDIAPWFRLILKENYLSSSTFPQEDTRKTRSLWWDRRKKLDQGLGKMLRDLEDLWFGPWKYLLLGEWSDCTRLDLVRDLTRKCKLDLNESLLRVILGGAKYNHKKEECVRQLSLNKGCYIGEFGCCEEKGCTTLPKTGNGVENFSLLLEAVEELEREEGLQREPIILVLDCEVQMLPWENMPILRSQEVYRMPSVISITKALGTSRQCQEQEERIIATFPFIDPLDAFYLLNPSGDLSSTQVQFEKWFKDQKLEGNAGNAPRVDELATALKCHDLFIYFGHGSGAQYIPGHEIQKLDSCAATLLMGCSSGSLSLNGSYSPQGIPLSYLLAGSPVIVANLWEVTDKDIDRFGKSMLDAWLRERSNPFSGYDHRPKIGSFISQAREACILPFLIGAAPVCYGVPTGIRRKKEL